MIFLLHEKDILLAETYFLSFLSQFKTVWLLVSMYEQYVWKQSYLSKIICDQASFFLVFADDE